MSAAMGVTQLKKIDFLLNRRKELTESYLDELQEIHEIKLPNIKPENVSTWFVFPIRVKEDIRDILINKLLEKGIQSKAYFYPCIHLQPFYKKEFGYSETMFPVAERLSRQTLILPLFPALKQEDIKIVKNKLLESLNEINNEQKRA
tara:strand:- start:182 stop:622 length:441 start_codon:yes stop_codon:yes gene_type:complete